MSDSPVRVGTRTVSAYALRCVTEAAACATFDCIGPGDKVQGDAAAVHAVRTTPNRMEFAGTVVIGEGEKDEAPELYRGEREAGVSTERWYRLEEMVISPEPIFCTTGITTGLLFEGVELQGGRHRTQSLMISALAAES
jgi:fructose-1,6-bisphosphatase/sedoheptulose 1,7-bisphosphatase-like protein